MIIIAYPVGIASGGKVRGTGTQPMSTITLENVSKYYKNKRRSGAGNRYEVGVENVNLTIGQGEFVFITGSSGAGKSTLLGLISGRLKPDRGRVLLDGVNTARSEMWRRSTR